MKNRNIAAFLAALVALITLAVYLTALRNDFVIWDDDVNVLKNFHTHFLNSAFFKWAIGDISMSYWQPVTWLTYAIDYSIWGAQPAGHHLTNILLHAANTFLAVCLIIRLLEAANNSGGGSGQAPFLNGPAILAAGAVTGALFGLHPLHVESTAWVTGRTDLLCTFFFLLSVMAYSRYVVAVRTKAGAHETQAFYRYKPYLLALAFFVLSLASKPMAVTLPAVLLLLDWYPFQRARSVKNLIPLLIEKIPFAALSFFVSIMTFAGQKAHGDLTPLADVPLTSRALVAAQALVLYLWKMLVPLNLSPFYPYPDRVSFFSSEYFFGVLLVCVITTACFLAAKKHKLALAVWGYYCITLLPVLGIIKVRMVSMADRFTYLPSLGPFLLIGLAAAWTWSWADTGKQQSLPVKRIVMVLAISYCMVLSYLTVKQIAVWKNSITLWSYVIEKEPGRVPAAHHNRGLAYQELGLKDEALKDYSTAIALHPDSPVTYTNRGLLYKELGQLDRALDDFNSAIALDPQSADAYTSRGWTFREMGRMDKAMEDYDRAIALDPTRYIAYNNRGMALREMGQLQAAIEDFTASLNLNPFYAQAYTNRGLAFEQSGRTDLALEDYTSAIRADPSFANAYNNRGLVLERTGRPDLSLEDFNTAIRLNPSGVEAYINRGLAYEDMGKFERAVEDYGRAIELKPDDYLAYSNRGIALAKMGRFDRAVSDHTKALSLKPDFTRAYLDRGDCYRAMGKPGLAMRDYRKACDLGSAAGCDAMQKGP